MFEKDHKLVRKKLSGVLERSGECRFRELFFSCRILLGGVMDLPEEGEVRKVTNKHLAYSELYTEQSPLSIRPVEQAGT